MKLGPGYSVVLPLAQLVDQELTAWEGAIELANGLYGLRDELVNLGLLANVVAQAGENIEERGRADRRTAAAVGETHPRRPGRRCAGRGAKARAVAARPGQRHSEPAWQDAGRGSVHAERFGPQ